MTRPTYAYGVIILPPPDLYRELLGIRERHPLLRSPVPPHITVKSPFIYRHTGAAVVEQLEAICEHWAPFEVQLSGLGVFRSSILYVKVEESKELDGLHHDLVEGLDGFVETLNDRYDGDAYTPHLTLAESMAPEDLPEAKRALADIRFRRRFVVDRVHLLRGRGKWDITRSFPLGPA
ncbi:MAG TPA: 2'-5' RNA ligase family protein [Symbiobacteriaceae bacterium]|nr:2'-5' RNA ligase family protein [Symbiobacteriaceae bacterium]